MDHPRQLIRHRVVGLLTAEVPAFRERVYGSRLYPMQRSQLPGACVYTLTEANELLTVQHRLIRRLNLAIDIYVRELAAPDDELDTLALAVETAMGADRTLGGTCQRHHLAETTIGFDGQGEKANALARLRYEIVYSTAG